MKTSKRISQLVQVFAAASFSVLWIQSALAQICIPTAGTAFPVLEAGISRGAVSGTVPYSAYPDPSNPPTPSNPSGGFFLYASGFALGATFNVPGQAEWFTPVYSSIGQAGGYTNTMIFAADGTISGTSVETVEGSTFNWVFSGALPCSAAGPDSLNVSNSDPGNLVGFWASGDLCTSISSCSTAPYTSRKSYPPDVPSNGNLPLGLDNYVADPGLPNEVVAFTANHPPVWLQNVQWTAGPDTIPVAFGPPVVLPVKFWNASTSLLTTNQQLIQLAAMSVAVANSIFQSYDVGITVQANGYTNLPLSVIPFGAISCSDLIGILKSYPSSGAINVYFVNGISSGSNWENVFGTTSAALSCGGAILLNAAPQLVLLKQNGGQIEYLPTVSVDDLAHEIGHELGLLHVTMSSTNDSLYQGFDASDLMWPHTARLNPYLTSGQIWRTQFDARSTLNGGGGARQVLGLSVTFPGIFYGGPPRTGPTTTCDAFQGTPFGSCPAACKDLWGVHGNPSCQEK